MEYEFDIDDIREEIQNMSDEEKLEYLSDKQSEIEDEIEELGSQIEELGSFVEELEELVDKIKDKREQGIKEEVRHALNSIQLDIPLSWDNNGQLTTHIGDVFIRIWVSSDEISVSYKTVKHGIPYRELINKLFADAKFDGYFSFIYHIGNKNHKEVVTDIVTTLSNNKEKFEEIAGK